MISSSKHTKPKLLTSKSENVYKWYHQKRLFMNLLSDYIISYSLVIYLLKSLNIKHEKTLNINFNFHIFIPL